MTRLISAALVAGLAVAGAAAAHTPYLAPTSFAPDRPFVSAQAALSETNFFVPEFPIQGAGDFVATGPSGATVKADRVVTLKQYAAVEFALPADGTYRLSSGQRPGREFKWAKIGGAWAMVRPDNAPGGEGGAKAVAQSAIPAGAETMTSVAYLRADAYVTKGAPSRGALKPTGEGVEVEPITHPNEIFAGEAFKFRVLNDGKPVPGVEFHIARAGDVYNDKKFAYAGKSGADGAASATFAQPGAYVLELLYPGLADASGAPVPRSTVYSLTFEVTR